MTNSAPQLPCREDDPVARRYLSKQPTKTAELLGPTFCRMELYENDTPPRRHGTLVYGGAIILVTHSGTVMGLNYTNLSELRAEWRHSLKHFTHAARSA
jgi:hypothetical protein